MLRGVPMVEGLAGLSGLVTGQAGPLLYDTFTAAGGTAVTSHTPEVGGAWVDLLAGHVIQSNAARRTGAANPPITTQDLAAPNVVGSANLNASGFRQSSIVLRATDSNNCWVLAARFSDNQLVVYEVNAGVWTSRGSAAPTLTAGTWYAATFTANGTTVSLTCNGATASYASATFQQTATKHGFASNTDTNGQGVDDLLIYSV